MKLIYHYIYINMINKLQVNTLCSLLISTTVSEVLLFYILYFLSNYTATKYGHYLPQNILMACNFYIFLRKLEMTVTVTFYPSEMVCPTGSPSQMVFRYIIVLYIVF